MKTLPAWWLAPMLIALTLVVAACDEDDDEPGPTPTLAAATLTTTPAPEATATATAAAASPTPGPGTPTPPPGGDCPMEQSICNLASELEGLLSARDYDAVVELVAPGEIDCPAPGTPVPDPIQDICEQTPPGQDATGYSLARRYSEGYVTDAAGVAGFLQNFVEGANPGASDQFGPGDVHLYAVSCSQTMPSGCNRATIIFGAILGPSGEMRREVLLFWVPLHMAETETPIDSIWDGIVMPGEDAILFETGGNLFDVGEVFVLP